MKKLKLFFLAAVIMLTLSACAPTIQKFVTLPDPLQAAITALCVFVVGWVFAQVGAALPWFVKLFGQYTDEISFAIAGALIGVIQNWLALIPPAWEGVGNIALLLIVEVLGALQVFRLLGKAKVRSFRA